MEKLINLAKTFIINPKEAWEMVKDDESSAKDHIISYVLPLALIPAISTFIGLGFIGKGMFGASLAWGLSQGIISLISTVIGVFFSGFIIHILASSFETQVSLDKAVKLVGFAYTPLLVAGILNIVPILAMLLFLFGLYSLYVLYLGFKPMTGVKEEKSTGYFIVSIIVIIVAYMVIGFILGIIALAFGMSRMGAF